MSPPFFDATGISHFHITHPVGSGGQVIKKSLIPGDLFASMCRSSNTWSAVGFGLLGTFVAASLSYVIALDPGNGSIFSTKGLFFWLIFGAAVFLAVVPVWAALIWVLAKLILRKQDVAFWPTVRAVAYIQGTAHWIGWFPGLAPMMTLWAFWAAGYGLQRSYGIQNGFFRKAGVRAIAVVTGIVANVAMISLLYVLLTWGFQLTPPEVTAVVFNGQ